MNRTSGPERDYEKYPETEIERIRLANGFSRADVAYQLGVDYAQYWRWERAVARPHFRYIRPMAKIFDMDHMELWKLLCKEWKERRDREDALLEGTL